MRILLTIGQLLELTELLASTNSDYEAIRPLDLTERTVGNQRRYEITGVEWLSYTINA